MSHFHTRTFIILLSETNYRRFDYFNLTLIQLIDIKFLHRVLQNHPESTQYCDGPTNHLNLL